MSRKKDIHRGRPSAGENRHVCDAILDAAETLLVAHGTLVSAREIAHLANTTDTMINYYFGGKERLFKIVMQRSAQCITDRLSELDRTILSSSESPTKHIVKVCMALREEYKSYVSLYWMDPVTRHRIKHEIDEGLKFTSVDIMLNILKKLIDAGVYSPNLNTHYAAFSLISLVMSPILLDIVSPLMDLTPEELSSESWIIFISNMLDQQFRKGVVK